MVNISLRLTHSPLKVSFNSSINQKAIFNFVRTSGVNYRKTETVLCQDNYSWVRLSNLLSREIDSAQARLVNYFFVFNELSLLFSCKCCNIYILPATIVVFFILLSISNPDSFKLSWAKLFKKFNCRKSGNLLD